MCPSFGAAVFQKRVPSVLTAWLVTINARTYLLVDKDGKIKPAARAIAAASLKVSRGEDVPDYEALATRYNLLARREAKRRAPSASGSADATTEALAGLIRRQNEILLDIRAELSAMRQLSGAVTPPVEDSEEEVDDYGFDQENENEKEKEND
ncbi:hypothetical protein PT974_10444 [Cladobotryum mycophilum]|uniref:EKC/KEOPS complex subunit GON7 n=1 Tax=Cladobotryum mycophilum TaxID=491253 RepID=A0ABR0S9V8_9HYPO